MVNIAQVIFLYNVCPGRSKQQSIAYFPVKRWLCALGQHCTGKNLMQYWPWDSSQQCKEKNLFNIALILFRQHCTVKNPMQRCLWGSRQHCTRKNPFQYSRDNIAQVKTLSNVIREAPDNMAHEKILHNIAQEAPDKIAEKKIQCNVVWTASGPFSAIFFGPVNFLIITGCCKCHANTIQIFPILHNKNPGSTLNKKIRSYGTIPWSSHEF